MIAVLSGRVRFRVGFDPKLHGFFRFGLFRVQIKKIMFKTQNFSDRFGSDFQFGSVFARSKCNMPHVTCIQEVYKSKSITSLMKVLCLSLIKEMSNANAPKLPQALCVPDFKFNMLSISILTLAEGCVVAFYLSFCLI